MPCGYLSFGDDGIILAANATLLRLLGREGESLVGQHFESILTLPAKIFYQTHFFPLLKMSGTVEEVYLALKTASRDDLPVLINAVRREMEGFFVNECVVVAMRRRSLYEDEILRAKKDLEAANLEKEEANLSLGVAKLALEQKKDELQHRNCELEELREMLELRVEQRTGSLVRANADLESFCYAVAHDLRAPLRGIISTSTILKEQIAAEISEEQLALLERQAFNGRKLADLIDDLLVFARLGHDAIIPADVNISQLTTEIIGRLEIPSTRVKPTFSVQPGMRAVGDKALLRIVLQNLIENAAKYSPEGGEIHIGSTSAGGQTTYFVRDHGIGFDMAYATKIFMPFQRLHRDSEFEGSGVGLATATRIVERHGGKVWAESVVGEGSSFYFTLPDEPTPTTLPNSFPPG